MSAEYEIIKYTQDRHPESHIHEFYEIFISLSNDGKFFVEEKAFPLTFGTIFFLNPFVIHHCFSHTNESYERYVIHFSREQLERMSTKNTDLVSTFNSAPVVRKLPDETLANLVGKLAELTKPVTAKFGDDVEHNLNFEYFLLQMAKSLDQLNDFTDTGKEKDNRVSDILSYIHRHYSENISLDDLSNRFFISKSRISQIFKDTTGFSIGNYIIVYRIKQACELLRNGSSVQDAGQKVGFNNNPHFIRVFKQHIGCSPGRFAREQDLKP